MNQNRFNHMSPNELKKVAKHLLLLQKTKCKIDKCDVKHHEK